MSEEIPPQFSPDGRYWWDGEQWIPADQLPRPLDPEEVSTWDTDDSGHKRSRLLLLLIPVGVVLVLIVGVVAGALTGLIHLPGTGGPTPHPTATPTPTPKPTPTPTLPVIAGLTAQNTIDYLATQDIVCNQPVTDQYHHQWWYCSKKGAPVYAVGIGGNDPQHVLVVKATVNDTRPQPDPKGATDFLASVAGVPYGDADPPQTQAWVRAHMGGGSTIIGRGAIKLSPGAGPGTWTLEITPRS